MSNSQTFGLWRRFTKRTNWHNEVHTYWRQFWCQLWRSSKLPKKTFYGHFEGFWWPWYVTSKLMSICVNLIVSINFFVNLLHSLGVWFFDIWHLFDNLTSVDILTHYLPCTPLPMCPKPLYLIAMPHCPCGLYPCTPYPIADCTPLPICLILLYPIAHVRHTPVPHCPCVPSSMWPIAPVPHSPCGLYPCTPYPCTLLPHCPCAPLPMWPIPLIIFFRFIVRTCLIIFCLCKVFRGYGVQDIYHPNWNKWKSSPCSISNC